MASEDCPLSEIEVIRIIREMLGSRTAAGLVLGPGDDAAVQQFPSAEVVLTVDAMFEGVHFTLETCELRDVGYKSLATSLSDIAAMGGEPVCALVSVSFARAPEEREVRGLYEGLLAMADEAGCPIVGGDVTRSRGGMSVTTAVGGVAHPNGPVTRSGARPGDLVGVTGTLGSSAAGFYVLGSGDAGLRVKYGSLVEAHLRPSPRIRAGQALASAGVSAMEDVSDGLAMEILHICDESGTGCEIAAQDIPLSGQVVALAREAGTSPLGWALGGGEDYELVFTAPPDSFDEALESVGRTGVQATGIGEIKPAGAGVVLVSADGGRGELEGTGYDHFL